MNSGGFTAVPDDLRAGAADLRQAADLDDSAAGLISGGTGSAAAFGLSANATQLARSWNLAVQARTTETTTLGAQTTSLANGLDADANAYERSDQSNRDRFRAIGGIGAAMATVGVPGPGSGSGQSGAVKADAVGAPSLGSGPGQPGAAMADPVGAHGSGASSGQSGAAVADAVAASGSGSGPGQSGATVADPVGAPGSGSDPVGASGSGSGSGLVGAPGTGSGSGSGAVSGSGSGIGSGPGQPGQGTGAPGNGASPQHTFTHPGLAQAAASASITTLQAAATKVGAMDPVTSLSWMDCAPVQIDGYATSVGDGGSQVDQAHQDFSAGRQTAERSWTGPAEQDFDQQATTLDGYYDTVHANIANTSDAGATIAGQLNAWADDTASAAERIAGDAAADCQIVLHLGPADPDYPEAADNVHLACADIAEEVTGHTNRITELNQLVAQLTTVSPYPARGAMGKVR